MILLADVMPDVPMKVTGAWMLGLLGLLGIVYVVLGVVIQWKKLFGRTPPINEELERRDKRLHQAMHDGDTALANRIMGMEERFEELQAERLRNWNELTTKIHTVGLDVAFIRGEMQKKPHRHI